MFWHFVDLLPQLSYGSHLVNVNQVLQFQLVIKWLCPGGSTEPLCFLRDLGIISVEGAASKEHKQYFGRHLPPWGLRMCSKLEKLFSSVKEERLFLYLFRGIWSSKFSVLSTRKCPHLNSQNLALFQLQFWTKYMRYVKATYLASFVVSYLKLNLGSDFMQSALYP